MLHFLKEVVLRHKADLVALVLYFLFTVCFLLPLVAKCRSYLPDTGDSLHNLWIMGSNAQKILNGNLNFHDANIFYPEENTGTFAETNFAQSVIFIPFYLADVPVLGYNFQVFLAFLLSAFFAYKIAVYFTRNEVASFIAGFIFAFFPYRYAHLPHLQIISTQWLLLAFYIFIRYLDRPTLSNGLLFFSAFLFQSISWGYSTAYLYIVVCGYAVFKVIFSGSRKGAVFLLKKTVLVFTPILIVSAFFYLPYIRAFKSGYWRPSSETDMYGNDLLFYLIASPINLLYGDFGERLSHIRPDWQISAVFSGFLTPLLFWLSVFKLKITRGFKNIMLIFDSERGPRLFFLLLTILGFALSLGGIIKVAGIPLVPNYLFRLTEILIFGKSMRYVPNYIVLVMIGVSLVIALGLKPFFDNKKIGNIWKAASVAFLTFVLSLEFCSHVSMVPFPYFKDNVPEVYRWLGDLKEDVVIFETPFISRLTPTDPYYFEQFKYMYFSIYHHKRMVNGIGGFSPDKFISLIDATGNFPDEVSIKQLKDMGVSYIVVHKDLFKNQDEYQSLLFNVNDLGDEIQRTKDFENGDVVLKLQ